MISDSPSVGASEEIKPSPENNEVYVVPIETILPTSENWTIYRRPDLNDPTFVDLCQSILRTGISCPLELSRDLHIISGHRRHLAAVHCGLAELPCLIDRDVVMGDLTERERVQLLTERNKGVRVKSDGELYMEAAAAVDPQAAIRKAQARKAQVLNKAKKSGLTEVETNGEITRTDPTGERKAMLDAVLLILEEKRRNGFLPTSSRSIHYKLLQLKFGRQRGAMVTSTAHVRARTRF